MEYFSALFFLVVLTGILWKMKADYLFVLFSFTAYLFLLFYIVKYNPSGLSLSVLKLVIVNPNGLFMLIIILVAPPIIDYICKQLKKRSLNTS
jgi:hypothetical protein